ncbi:hypothetical protein [Superficieibacter electus]|uniref:hypothetical protein n=1 Tax=Superficieibacter electus TaxID=2022662 RepID=UPI00159ECA99|nr:hypothetical protein [Superficieibacter electus]
MHANAAAINTIAAMAPQEDHPALFAGKMIPAANGIENVVRLTIHKLPGSPHYQLQNQS